MYYTYSTTLLIAASLAFSSCCALITSLFERKGSLNGSRFINVASCWSSDVAAETVAGLLAELELPAVDGPAADAVTAGRDSQ